MKTAQYVSAEKGIAAADSGGIWERWRYGLRLLADPQAISTGNGGGLRHGAADKLIAAAQAKGLRLSQREIQNRVQCAKTYPTESQMRNIISCFGTWFELVQARFPGVERDPGEPAADYRTTSERRHDAARQMALDVIDQDHLFPLARFEPDVVVLKDLVDYTNEQDQITESFARTGRERHRYLNRLLEAVGYDVARTWRDAHRAAYGTGPE
jgi:hypothetical protein